MLVNRPAVREKFCKNFKNSHVYGCFFRPIPPPLLLFRSLRIFHPRFYVSRDSLQEEAVLEISDEITVLFVFMTVVDLTFASESSFSQLCQIIIYNSPSAFIRIREIKVNASKV